MESLDRNNRQIAAWGLGITVLAGLLAVLSGPLYQMKLLALMPAFALLRYAVYGAIAGAAICLISLLLALLRRGFGGVAGSPTAWAGLLLGLAVFYVPYSVRAGGYPPIHDVTTDIVDPPAFVAALAPRAAGGATNAAEYIRIVKSPRGGPDFNVPELQQKAFPDIQPIRLELAPDPAFQKALDAVKAMNWTLIESRPAEGRIEAYDRTTWFGFIDDVVIRVRADGAGSRIDVRSVSRIGFGDIGTNAKRIRAYTQQLAGESGAR